MATPTAAPPPITAPYSPQTPAVSVLLMLVVTACTAWLVFVVSLNTAVKDLQDAATRRLDTAAAALTSALVRFDYLPALLETTPAVMELLARPGEPVLRDRANHTLLRINAIAGADMLFVLDERGDALAAADWDQPSTTVGHNYTYRPYMKGALAQGRGRFFGVGATSRVPGYFLSYALRQGSRTLGVATVKVNLDAAEHEWAAQPGHTLVSDERGVVILSSRPQWKFSALRPLTAAERAQVLDEKPYSADPPLVPWVQADAQPRSGEKVLVDGQMHLVTALALPTQRWHMQALDPMAPAQARARNSALVAALATAVTLLLSTAAWQNRRVALDKLATQAALQAAYDTLEARVAQRTAELSSANASLAAEVQIRKTVEQDLRETQQELVHAAKLAVLGQISAGLAHELNQPLAALRTLSDNALVLMEKERLPETRGNLERISQLVGRLGELTRRLKTFAHKPGTQPVPTPLRAAAGNAQALLAERLRRAAVSLTVEVEPEALAVLAEPSQIEQVLVNLLANAIDALASDARPDAPPRQVVLRARSEGTRVLIEVCDSGPGIAPAMRERLFEPFATSKPAGAGLGLGLMISRRIVRAFGGELSAADAPQGGSRFVIDLPAVPDPETALADAEAPPPFPAQTQTTRVP